MTREEKLLAPANQSIDLSDEYEARGNVVDINSRRQEPVSIAGVTARYHDALGAAAYALADLNGEIWAEMTPLKLDIYRRLAKFAADLVDPKKGRLFAYVIERERVRAEHGPRLGELTPRERRLRVNEIVAGLTSACEAAYGLRPSVLHLAEELQAHDERERIAAGEVW